VTLKMIRISFD